MRSNQAYTKESSKSIHGFSDLIVNDERLVELKSEIDYQDNK